MKRIMCVLLILTMALLFCGCNAVDPLELEGYYTISEEDKPIIESVASRFDFTLTQYDSLVPDNFVDKIDNVKSGTYSLYKASIDIDSCYYLCGYGNSDLSFFMYMTIGEYSWLYDWYRVDSFENIQKSINNKELIHLFVVYDAVIERDLLDGTVYNHKTKYYNKQSDVDTEIVLQNDTYIIYRREYLINENNYPYLTASDLNDGYVMYIDENGIEYLSFLHELYSETNDLTENKSEELFLDYYDILSPYFVSIDELDERYNYDGNSILKKHSGIEVDRLLDLTVR